MLVFLKVYIYQASPDSCRFMYCKIWFKEDQAYSMVKLHSFVSFFAAFHNNMTKWHWFVSIFAACHSFIWPWNTDLFWSLQAVTAPYDRVFFAEEDEKKEVEDNCKILKYWTYVLFLWLMLESLVFIAFIIMLVRFSFVQFTVALFTVHIYLVLFSSSAVV